MMRFSSPDQEDEVAFAERIARVAAERRVQRWYRDKLTLRAVTFPIYAAEGWPAQISGSGSRGGDLTDLTIAHTEIEDADLVDGRPRIEITTSTREPRHNEIGVARQQLEQWIHLDNMHAHSPDLSDAAITLWFRAVDRRRRAAALNAARSEAQVTIDGTATPFLTLTTPGGRWVAVRRHNDLTVTIAARDIDPTTITLEPIPDPAASAANPWTAERRAVACLTRPGRRLRRAMARVPFAMACGSARLRTRRPGDRAAAAEATQQQCRVSPAATHRPTRPRLTHPHVRSVFALTDTLVALLVAVPASTVRAHDLVSEGVMV
jgi:hypothetical protein